MPDERQGPSLRCAPHHQLTLTIPIPLAQDAYLYYFLLRYPGRTLVFLSSIDGIRRLLPIMSLLDIPAFPLHSQLEQRQRLKNLDRCVAPTSHTYSSLNTSR